MIAFLTTAAPGVEQLDPGKPELRRRHAGASGVSWRAVAGPRVVPGGRAAPVLVGRRTIRVPSPLHQAAAAAGGPGIRSGRRANRSADAGGQHHPNGSENRLATVLVNAPLDTEGKLTVVLDDTDAAGVLRGRLEAEQGRQGGTAALRGQRRSVRRRTSRCSGGPSWPPGSKTPTASSTRRQASATPPKTAAARNLSLLLLFALVALLVSKQLLAYSASYHPKSSTADSRLGQPGRGPGHNRRLGRSEAEPQPVLADKVGR